MSHDQSTKDRRHHHTKIASSRLKPLDFKITNMIRRQDVAVFLAAADMFNHVILVRATNADSLPYLGQKGYGPKPLDCKPKTADRDVFAAGHQVRCAGLVVDPTMVGPQAFATDGKRKDSLKLWDKFLGTASPNERQLRVFRRLGQGGFCGFFAVDTWGPSKHHGCLMMTDLQLPTREFDLRLERFQDFKNANLSYICGDYDLYGLIDIDAEDKVRHREIHRGQPNFFTKHFKKIQDFINTGIGVDVIQHGAQDNVAHQGDQVYVFLPLGAYYMDESADAIRDVYDLLFKQDGGFVSR